MDFVYESSDSDDDLLGIIPIDMKSSHNLNEKHNFSLLSVRGTGSSVPELEVETINSQTFKPSRNVKLYNENLSKPCRVNNKWIYCRQNNKNGTNSWIKNRKENLLLKSHVKSSHDIDNNSLFKLEELNQEHLVPTMEIIDNGQNTDMK